MQFQHVDVVQLHTEEQTTEIVLFVLQHRLHVYVVQLIINAQHTSIALFVKFSQNAYVAQLHIEHHRIEIVPIIM